MYRPRQPALTAILAAMLLCGAFSACGNGDTSAPATSTSSSGSGGAATSGVGGGGGYGDGGSGLFGTGGGGGNPSYADFPVAPVVEAGLPSDIASMFGVDVSNAGPCMSEPPMDAMFPNNWTAPLFEWSAPANANVFELRLAMDNQDNDLVVYTSDIRYTLPDALWDVVKVHGSGHDVDVSIRSATLEAGALSAGPDLGTSGTVHIAPAAAAGSVVYWTTSNGSALKGFEIGAKDVSLVADPTLMGDGTTCVGCHSSSPDGEYVFLTRNGSPFSVNARTVDGTATVAPTSVVSGNADTLFQRSNQTLPVFSPAHYSGTDAVALTVLSHADTNHRYELVWTDLRASAAGSGIISRNGDDRQPATPDWSDDGTTIVYTSLNDVVDGRTGVGPMDLYTVPYNDKAGGTASALGEAADPNVNEYYPTFSPGDQLVAFNRSPLGLNSYNQPQAEIYLVARDGTGLTRHAANDPAACTNITSPGITNSWARWAPEATVVGNDKYYWLVFSSQRRPGTIQLFVAAVVTDPTVAGEPIKRTYPAVYVTTQPEAENNHTPAWDVFNVPPVPN